MHGYDPGELVGRTVWSLVKDEKRRVELRTYLAYLVESQPEPSPYYSVDLTKDGGEVAVRVNWNYEHNARGDVAGFLCAIFECPHPDNCDSSIDDAVRDALASLQRLEALLAGTRTRTVPRDAAGLLRPALSTREQDVLDKLLLGQNPARIGEALGISVHTVRNHMKSIYRRFGVHSREELSALFLRGTAEWKE